jgi:hypothetical protein
MIDNGPERMHSPESKEFGENVEIVLKFIRHGERDLEGNLTEHGRTITKERAQTSDIKAADFDAVKAIGSAAGPAGSSGMGRSLETADIYAHEIAGDGAFRTRAYSVLNYGTLKSKIPFDWSVIYAAHLPENFSAMSPEEKVGAAKKAEAAVMDHLVGLHTPEAEAYKREAAGSLAYVIDHYRRMAQRMESGSKVLMPAGTHGGVMEFVLQEALVRTGDDGEKIKGFANLAEIGGEFNPSEAFNVDIATDEDGKEKPMKVTFDNKDRPLGEFYLDPDTMAELKDEYLKLHKAESSE